MKLIKSNLILKELPTKFRFVINVGNFGNFVGAGGLGGYFVISKNDLTSVNGPVAVEKMLNLPRVASNFLGIGSVEPINAS